MSEYQLDLYNKARFSNNVIATQIIKDIDAAIELLLEINNKEDEQSLIDEIDYFFTCQL